jgi:hypothetical protein
MFGPAPSQYCHIAVAHSQSRVVSSCLYVPFCPVTSQYCYIALARSQSGVLSSCSCALYAPCFVPPALSTVISHWLARRVVYFPPVPINYMYVALPRPLSVLSCRIGSLSEQCFFLLFLYTICTLFHPRGLGYSSFLKITVGFFKT